MTAQRQNRPEMTPAPESPTPDLPTPDLPTPDLPAPDLRASEYSAPPSAETNAAGADPASPPAAEMPQTPGEALAARAIHDRLIEDRPIAARILVSARTMERAALWANLIHSLGYETLTTGMNAPVSAMKDMGADCAVAELPAGGYLLEALEEGPDGTPPLPVMVLDGAPAIADRILAEGHGEAVPTLTTRTFEGPFDDTAPRDVPADALARHLRRRLMEMVRVRSMIDDWRRRQRLIEASVQEEAGGPEEAAWESLPVMVANRSRTILFAGEPGPDYPGLENRFADERTTVIAALTPSNTMDYLARHSFDGMVISVRTSVEDYLPVIAAVRRNARLSAMPIMVLLDEEARGQRHGALRAGASDVLCHPFQEDDLTLRLQVLLAENGLRLTLRTALAAPLPAPLTDPETGLAGEEAFADYLDLVAGDLRPSASASGTGRPAGAGPARPWSVIGFDLSRCQNGGPALMPVSDETFKAAVAVISRITRGIDLAARIGPRRIALALPGTNRVQALAVVRRILGALSATRFDGPGADGIRLVPDHGALDGIMVPVARKMGAKTGVSHGRTVLNSLQTRLDDGHGTG